MILFSNANVKLFIPEKKSLGTEVKKIEKSIKYITQIENNNSCMPSGELGKRSL
jgi:hypothetical protein